MKATNDIHIRRMDFCTYGYLFYHSEVFRASKLLNEESRQSGDEHTRIVEFTWKNYVSDSEEFELILRKCND